jgi:hypothetical protein
MDFDVSFLGEQKLEKLKQENILERLKFSLSIIHQAFTQYKYVTREISLILIRFSLTL